MQKRTFAFFTLLSLLTVLLTFVFTGGMASARSIASDEPLRTAAPTSAVVPLATGGCAEHSGPNGTNGGYWEMGVCISDRGTGNIVYPDVYVNIAPEGPVICSLHVELWEGNYKWTEVDYGTCAPGHYNGGALGIGSGICLALHSSVWISFGSGGSFYRMGDSPTYTYCA